jgi:hypothetical protein
VTIVDFATRADLAGRLRGLVIMLDEYLTLEQCRTADQAIDADDYGPALEMLAGWLAEAATPIPDDIRRDFERLSSQIGNVEAVMVPLDERCPVAPEE